MKIGQETKAFETSFINVILYGNECQNFFYHMAKKTKTKKNAYRKCLISVWNTV